MKEVITEEAPIETAKKETDTISVENILLEDISVERHSTTKTVNVSDIVHEIIELDGQDPGQFLDNFFHLIIPTLHPGIYNIKSRPDTLFSHIFEGDLNQGPDWESAVFKKVVFKIMRYDPFSGDGQERVEHFIQEAKIHKAVSEHPLNQQKNRVTMVYDFGTFDDAYYTGSWDNNVKYRNMHYLISEFLEDRSLEDVLTRNGRPLKEKAGMIRDIAEGLEITHKAGYVHFDVKPKNAVHSARTGEVKIMDFGIAKPIGSSISRDCVVGTPDYISPEVVKGHDADPRMDIFSFGILIYHMLEELHPYAGNSTEMDAILYSTIRNDLILPRNKEGIDTGLAHVAIKCVAKDPAERYQDMGEVVQAIDSCKF